MKQAQLISIAIYGMLAWWYVAPYLKRLSLATAMTLLLWVHAFRYCVLYLFVARQEGYAVSDAAFNGLVVGDLAGAALALIAIVALRGARRVGLALSWLVIVATLIDALYGVYLRATEPPRLDATGVWWLIFVFFAPAIIVSLPLMGWQLITRRAEPLVPASS